MKKLKARGFTVFLTFSSVAVFLLLWMRLSWIPMFWLPQERDMVLSQKAKAVERSWHGLKDEVLSRDHVPKNSDGIATAQEAVKTWSGHVYAIGDLHGDMENTLAILATTGIINQQGEWIAGDALLIQTGDIADRGPDAVPLYAFFQKLGIQAKKVNGKVVQLLGNHESLLVCGMYHYLHPAELGLYYQSSPRVLADSWSPSGLLGQHVRNTFHVAVVSNDILFVHAGMLPLHAKLPLIELHKRLWQNVDDDGCVPSPPASSYDVVGDTGPLWTRLLVELPEGKACKILRQTLEEAGAKRMVVGHTPTDSRQIETRCDNQLIVIDSGLSKYLYNSPTMMQISNGTFIEHSLSKVDGTGNSRLVVPQTRTLFTDARLKERQAKLNKHDVTKADSRQQNKKPQGATKNQETEEDPEENEVTAKESDENSQATANEQTVPNFQNITLIAEL